ncbi:MAG: hypothetical protein ACR2QF_10235, partial [Geminicoccaceae bacterium]
MPHGVAIKNLKGKYQEETVAGGLRADGNLLQVWASPDGKTWTVTVTTPQGITCVMSAGSMWRRSPMPVVDLES